MPLLLLSKKIISEIYEERQRQIDKGYTDATADAQKDIDDWCDDVIAYATWAKQMAKMGSPDKYRNRMKQIATMAAAACDSYDRVKSRPAPVMDAQSLAARKMHDTLIDCRGITSQEIPVENYKYK